ncbi:replication initiation protein [Photobacterium leiognathi]|uniref:replication initiation protein n=1 Tax=Photobacterium leiognathi TaxID=553611 RepID=UPI0027393977|nr:replication initiation protein [Photobacterium leiognathi]
MKKLFYFSDVSYNKGILTLEVSRSTAAKMLDYSNGFAEIDLRLLFSLKGAYEKRILEILSRFKNKRDFKVSIEDYSLMIGSQRDRYKTFSDFRKVVIERPLQKIISKSNGVWAAKDDAKKVMNWLKMEEATVISYSKCNGMNQRKNQKQNNLNYRHPPCLLMMQ